MSIGRDRAAAAAALSAFIMLLAPPVEAQSEAGGDDRFFAEKVADVEADGDEPTAERTLFQGSLTSTTFAYSERGGLAEGVGDNLDNASPAGRVFTDLRAQLDGKHLSGSRWNMRADTRVRVSLPCQFYSVDQNANGAYYNNTQCRTQSGAYGGNEYDARELYAHRDGKKIDVYLGRQYVTELAATKIDGLRFQYHKSNKLDLIGFAGLYPARGSRSLVSDYPNAYLGNGEEGGRITPVAAGLGGAYRFRKLYGSVGAVGIMPMAAGTEINEEPRIFLTGSGYWRQSHKLDLYHYAVFDVESVAGPALTNLSLGANFHPAPNLRVTGAIHRVDTETLNVIAQTRLADVEPGIGANWARNDIEVQRIASQSARIGVSLAMMQQRFEVSASTGVRHRPDAIELKNNDNQVVEVLPTSRAAEVLLSVVDRRSILGLRLGASLLRSFPIGGENYNQSQAMLIRLDGSREIKGGKGQVEVNLSYVSSEDDDRDVDCGVDILTCYGTTDATTMSAGSTVYYRLKPDWFVIGSAIVGLQNFQTYFNGQEYIQPRNLLLTGFARVAYRF